MEAEQSQVVNTAGVGEQRTGFQGLRGYALRAPRRSTRSWRRSSRRW